MPEPAEPDYAAQRAQMVERQLVSRGIHDERVLQAMATVPRERFLPESERSRAYIDNALAIPEGQTMSQPWIVAFMSEALALTGNERVLEVGTGSGYGAAVLASLAAEVWTVERHLLLADRATALLGELGYENVHVVCANGALGLSEHSPFAAISVTARTAEPPPALLEQLEDGGRLICPIHSGDADWLTLYRRRGDERETQRLVPCRFVPLVG